MNKISEFNILVEQYNVQIVCVTETHLSPEIKDCEVILENFKLYRNDRKTGEKGGGSCIFVHKSIDADGIPNFQPPDTTGIQTKINGHPLKLVCAYRSQNLSFLDQNQLLSQIGNVQINPEEELILVGDFNFTNVNWDSMTVNCNENTCNTNLILQKQYLDTFSEMGISSILENGTVTRRRVVGGNLQESHLDQILCSNTDIVLSAETVSPVGKSDHLGILVNIKLKNNIEYIQLEKQNWSKMSSEKIQSCGDIINWEYSSENLSSNEMCEEISSKLGTISEKVPKVSIKTTKNGDLISKSPWDCTQLKRKRKKKDHAWKVFENSPISENLNTALGIQGEYEKMETEKMICHEKKIVSYIKTNPKIFYKYLNSKRKVKESVSALKTNLGKLTNDPKHAANLLANFFSSTFTCETYGPLEEKCFKLPENFIGDLVITSEMVKKTLLKLDKSKAMGPDNIHPKLLVYLAENESFVEAVTLLFKKCYTSGQIPLVWKTANVTALHKKGSKTDPSHYRPISLTCILCKVYESNIRSHVFKHILNQINKVQHGFMPNRSCLSNLMESFDVINDMLANGDAIDIFYLDFQKAFDTVPHYRLIEKLKSFGLCDGLLNVIADFLKNRTFKVIVGNSSSDSYKVTSGIPQGSVLGPLLFLLYINDLPECIINRVSLFADDLKMFGKSSMKDTIQTDLDQLVSWQNTWLLFFNTTDQKCKVLHVGANNPHNKYCLGEVELPEIETEKDLGVLISKDWNFNQHINSIVNKANSTSAWVLRSVISRSSNVLLKIYQSIIRPHLEYCVQLWSPLPAHGNWGAILSIENVQRQLTRSVDGVGLLTYKTRLEKLGLTTLLERRLRGDLIETFRIVSGIADYGSTFFRTSQSGRNLLSRPGDQNSKKYGFLSRRVIHYWNKLPSHVKNSETVNQFKNRLDTFRKNNLDLPGHFWEISNEIFTRINDTNRDNYVNFMKNNPIVARLKNISII